MSETQKGTLSALGDPAKEFFKEEQKQRRAEIENLIGRIEGDQRYGLVVTGLVWSWLATNRDKLQPPFDLIAVFLPALVMVFFLWRWKALDWSVLQVAEYTKKLEALVGLPDGFGWETFLERERAKTGKQDALAVSTWRYWWLLILANLVLAGLFIWFLRR